MILQFLNANCPQGVVRSLMTMVVVLEASIVVDGRLVLELPAASSAGNRFFRVMEK